MEKVSIAEFRKRMAFWLQNLPIELVSRSEVVAIVSASCTSKEAPLCTSASKSLRTTILTGTKEEKVAELREMIKPFETKVDTSTGEISQPDQERRRYIEYDEQRGEDIIIEGTFEDFRKRCGKKQRALATWKAAKPLTS